MVKGCLDSGLKFFYVTSNISREVERGVRMLIKKTNYITHLKTARRIY
jgi:hypothetical protein